MMFDRKLEKETSCQVYFTTLIIKKKYCTNYDKPQFFNYYSKYL